MASDRAFLEAIREEPEEDAHRFAYADWLMERDDPRGEFIRVQCELARLAGDAPKAAGLKARETELLKRHRVAWTDRAFVAWLKHPKRTCRNPEGHRFCQILAKGIAARCDLDALPAGDPGRERFQKVIDACGQEIDSLGYNAETATLPLFDGCEFRRGFIDSVEADDWEVQLFAETLFDLSILRELTIDNELTDDRADEAMEALVRVGRRSELRVLDFWVSPNSLEPLAELAASPILSSLTHLGIMLPDPGEVAAAKTLANSPHLANLRRLQVSCEEPSDEILQAILDSPHLVGLTELHIEYEGTGFSPALVRHARKRFGGATTRGIPGILFRRAEPKARSRRKTS